MLLYHLTTQTFRSIGNLETIGFKILQPNIQHHFIECLHKFTMVSFIPVQQQEQQHDNNNNNYNNTTMTTTTTMSIDDDDYKNIFIFITEKQITKSIKDPYT